MLRPSTKLVRLDDDCYVIHDPELLLVCSGATTFGRVDLLGLAFKTASAGWRCLRLGMIDIGYRPTQPDALECILLDACRGQCRRIVQ